MDGEEYPKPESGSAEDIRNSLRGSVKVLADLGFGSELQREILRRLIEGRRTITEVVELIFHTSRSDAGFHADFMKVSRAMRRLENRGFVATNIFGRDKPYRLTTHALETLYYLGQPGEARQRLVQKRDVTVYVSTLMAGAAILASIWNSPKLPEPVWVFLPASFFLILVGISLCRMASMMRRVL